MSKSVNHVTSSMYQDISCWFHNKIHGVNHICADDHNMCDEIENKDGSGGVHYDGDDYHVFKWRWLYFWMMMLMYLNDDNDNASSDDDDDGI